MARANREGQPGAFSTELKRLMHRRAISLRELGHVASFSYGYLGRIARGAQPATRDVAERCDAALGADGALIRAWYASSGVVRPRQLPPAPARLAGRAAEFSALDEAITERAPGAPAVVVIDGPAGAGKTALALCWAHRAAEEFVDGHLYADLRGFASPDTRPANPEDVLESMCRSLDAPHIPQGREQRTALCRSLLRDRRMLIVCDNAADTAQVEPLIPAAEGCAVVVTSRRVLSRLATHYDGRRITVGPIPGDDAVSLVRQLIGPRRADAELDAVRTLTELCGGLPLALRAAADLVAVYPHRDIAGLVAELVDHETRLDILDTDQRTVRDVLSWSVNALAPPAARVFQLMGLHRELHDEPVISPAAVTALTGGTPAETYAMLRQLAQLHLIEMHSAQVISMHELVQAYARVLATELSTDARDDATERLADWRVRAAG